MRRIIRFLAMVGLVAAPAHALLTQRCNWGVGVNAPAVFPLSTQVMSTPIVLNFGLPGGFAQIAFVSFENASQANRDGGGVLRVIDRQCQEIARFPNPGAPGCAFPPMLNAPAGFGVTPDLASISGIAGGNIDNTGNAEIIGVIGGPTNQHRQIVAFNLVGNCIMPKWISSAAALPPNDFIMPASPAIAQLDRPPVPNWQNAEIILDNKVFNANGTLRYTGFNGGGPGNNCAGAGGAPCPRSHTVSVANVQGAPLPQLITGRGIYRSTSPAGWTGPVLPPPTITAASNTSPGLTYPAIAELEPTSPGPEIVVTDTMLSRLWVFSSTGTTLAFAPIPGAAGARCGGPPMIADVAGTAVPEIGVAGCTTYTVFKYSAGSLAPMWSKPINDPSGQTTSTLYHLVPPVAGTRIVYADALNITVFNGATGAVVQTVPNTSATAWEGPVIASLDTGNQMTDCLMSKGAIIVASNNYATVGGTRGVRTFDDTDLGTVASCWNEGMFHITNLTNSFGQIPLTETPSWVAFPARNTYRVQRWP